MCLDKEKKVEVRYHVHMYTHCMFARCVITAEELDSPCCKLSGEEGQ